MKHKLLILTLIHLCFLKMSVASDEQSFRIYKNDGTEYTIKSLAEYTQKQADVVLFGEFHDDSICHLAELQFLKEQLNFQRALEVGMEMFETDDQLKIDEYFEEKINQRSFENEVRLWNNYTSDYRPILELAKANKIPFIATNVPRRYASMVYRLGMESLKTLSKAAKKYLPPLPIKVDLSLSTYQEMLTMGGGHGGENFPKAQAIKDATMAHFILKNHRRKKLFIHYNGNYHSKQYQGIYWYLKQKKKSLKVITIATTYQEEVNQLEENNKNEADFMLCIKTPPNN